VSAGRRRAPGPRRVWLIGPARGAQPLAGRDRPLPVPNPGHWRPGRSDRSGDRWLPGRPFLVSDRYSCSTSLSPLPPSFSPSGSSRRAEVPRRRGRRSGPAGRRAGDPGVGAILWGLTEAPDSGWLYLPVLVALVVGLLATAAFVMWERACTGPLFQPNLRFAARPGSAWERRFDRPPALGGLRVCVSSTRAGRRRRPIRPGPLWSPSRR
jgi:hypothetical protein